jgi:hypothetical protein
LVGGRSRLARVTKDRRQSFELLIRASRGRDDADDIADHVVDAVGDVTDATAVRTWPRDVASKGDPASVLDHDS